jgi:hypothetical protein
LGDLALSQGWPELHVPKHGADTEAQEPCWGLELGLWEVGLGTEIGLARGDPAGF